MYVSSEASKETQCNSGVAPRLSKVENRRKPKPERKGEANLAPTVAFGDTFPRSAGAGWRALSRDVPRSSNAVSMYGCQGTNAASEGEIRKKGDGSRFRKISRGQFEFARA